MAFHTAPTVHNGTAMFGPFVSFKKICKKPDRKYRIQIEGS